MNYENTYEIETSLEKLLAQGKLKNRKILVFGAIDSAEAVDRYLRSEGLRIYGVINNDKSLHGIYLEKLSVSVTSPEEQFKSGIKTYTVLIASRHYGQMLEQLKKYGFTEYKNVFQIADYKFHNNSDLSVKSFFYYLTGVYKGWKIKRGLFKSLGLQKKGKLYVLGYCALGDAYLVCSYLKNYYAINSATDWALIYQERDVIKKIVKMFRLPKTAAVRYPDRLLLLAYARFRKEASGVEFVCLSKNHINNLSKAFGIKGLNMADLFSIGFGFENKYAKAHLSTWQPVSDCLIKQGKTVILFPYAYTTPLIDKSVWVGISEKLKELGHVVLTNTSGKNEPAVEGTLPIFIPVEQANVVVEYAGGVVMNRSGMSDVISASKCKKVILYPVFNKYNNVALIEIFGLKNMGLCDDAIEIQLNGSEHTEELADRIAKLFV